MSALNTEVSNATDKILSPKLSPLYAFVLQMRQENHTCLQNLEIAELRTQKAFLISIHSELEEDWVLKQGNLKQFFLKERHFRIDEIYKEGAAQHGLTPLHYTEIYGLAGSEQEIVVHAFLDKKRGYIYTQIRIFSSKDRTGSFQEIKVDALLENAIRRNMQEAIWDLGPLFEEWYLRSSIQIEKVEKLNEALGNLSQKALVDQKGLQAYQARFEELIREIEVKDQLTGEIDPRKNILHSVKEGIESWAERIQKARDLGSAVNVESSVSSGVSGDSSSSLSSSVLQQQSHSFSSEIAETVEVIGEKVLADLKRYNDSIALGELEKTLVAQDIGVILKRNVILEKANQLLLVIQGVPKKTLNIKPEAINKLFEAIFKKTEMHDAQCQALLKLAGFKGDLDKVKSLFQISRHKLKSDFYREFIEKAVDSIDAVERARLAAVCDYFYKESEKYRSVVFEMSVDQSYCIPKQDDRCRKFGIDVEISLLYKAYVQQNKLIFEMLLRHGATPDTWAVRAHDWSHHGFCLLYSIARFEPNNSFAKSQALVYINILLNYQVNVGATYAEKTSKISNQIKLKIAKKSNELKSNGFFGILKINPISLVTLMGQEHGLEGLRLILPYTSLKNMADYLGQLASYDTTNIVRCFSTKYFIGTYLTKDEGMAKFDQTIQSTSQTPFMSFIIYPNMSKPEFERRLFVEKMNFLYEAFRNKIKKLQSPSELIQIFNELFEISNQKILEGRFESAGDPLIACDFLLAEEPGLLSSKERLYWIEKICQGVIDKEKKEQKAIFPNNDATLRSKMMLQMHEFRINACRSELKLANQKGETIESLLADSALKLKLSANSAENLAWLLGFLTAGPHFIRKFFFSEEPKILFGKDEAEAMGWIQKYNEKKEITPFCTFIFFGNISNASVLNEFDEPVSKYVEKIREMKNKLTDKVESLEDEREFDRVYQWLFNYGSVKLSKKPGMNYRELREVLGAFQACEYLLAEKCNFLTSNEQLKLMKQYGVSLCEKIILVTMMRRGRSSTKDAEDFDSIENLYQKRIESIKNSRVQYDFSPLWQAFQEVYDNHENYYQKVVAGQKISCDEEICLFRKN